MDDDVTKISFIACIDAGEQRFLGVEITHLCNMFTVESYEAKIYACRLFEKHFDFAHGNEQSVAHKSITLTAKKGSYYFYKIESAPDNKNKSSSSGGGKDGESSTRRCC